MASAMRRAGQSGDGCQRRIVGKLRDQPGERTVDVRQCAGRAEVVEQFAVLHKLPPRQASMSAMQAADGTSWNTPWPGWVGLMPRTNR